jgi:RNA polymerase primary sigma factor
MANDLEKLINQALAPLSQRQKEVIKMRFGLRSQPLTLAAIGDQYDITRERVRQIEEKALKKLYRAMRRDRGLRAAGRT